MKPGSVQGVIGAAVLALAAGGAPRVGAAELLSGSKTLTAHLADGSRLVLGQVQFSPGEGGRTKFRIALDTARFSDHFLSMREFKCLEGGPELSCHVPYPYAHPGSVGPGDYAWLEHNLLFFYKLPADFGAKLWNGIYFEFKPEGAGLVGTPKAVDLNLIAAPPSNLAVAPYRKALRDEMPANARWIRSLHIE